MPLPPDQLARRLSRHGIPREQVARYVEELRDHREDLILELEQTGTAADEAGRLADHRLGDSDTLAKSLINAHRRQSFMGRHPWIFFVFVPALAVPLLVIGALLTIAICATCVAWMSRGFTQQEVHASANSWGLMTCALASNYLWPGFIGMLIYRAAWRRGLGWRWRIASCAIAVAWGSWLHCWTHAGDATHQGMFAMGAQPIPHITQAAAAVAWIVLCAWLLDRRSNVTDSTLMTP